MATPPPVFRARLNPDFCRDHDLTESEEAHILDRYLLPRPRTRLAGAVTDYASAAMDVSDGLFADCAHMASASALDLTIDLDQVPLFTGRSPISRIKSTRGLLPGA